MKNLLSPYRTVAQPNRRWTRNRSIDLAAHSNFVMQDKLTRYSYRSDNTLVRLTF